jgi:hypothetical protein
MLPKYLLHSVVVILFDKVLFQFAAKWRRLHENLKSTEIMKLLGGNFLRLAMSS